MTRWSTDEERDRRVATLLEKELDDLLKVLQELPRAGYIRTPDSLASDLHFARKTPSNNRGDRIFMATDRYISFWEATARPRTIDDPFTCVEPRVGPAGTGEGKMSLFTKVDVDRSCEHDRPGELWDRTCAAAERSQGAAAVTVNRRRNPPGSCMLALGLGDTLTRTLESIVDSIGDEFYACDHQWRIIYLNDAAVTAIRVARGDSLSRDEILGQPVWRMLSRHAASIFQQKCEEAARIRKSLTFEARSPVTDNWMRVRACPFEGGLTVCCEEVTSQKQADVDVDYRANLHVEDQLRRSEAHLAEVQRIAHVGSWTWHVPSGRLWWSLEHFHIFGLDPSTFIPTKENTQRLIHPEDLPFVERTLNEAVRRKRDFEVDYRIIRSDGSIRHHRGKGHPAVTEAGDLEFVGTVFDVTERMQSERRLRRSEAYLAAAQRISKTGSWAWSPSTGEIFWSLEHYRICGVDPASFTVTFDSALQLIHAADRSSAREAINWAARTRQPFAREFRIQRPDGTIREVCSVGEPSFNAAGECTEYVGTVMDVTERNTEARAGRELLRRLIAAQEDERRRISRELHDAVGQQLSLLAIGLARLRQDRGEQPFIDEMASIDRIVEGLETDFEFVVWQLRPSALDVLGLVGAFQDHVKRWSGHVGVRVGWHASGIEEASLTEEIEITLYRLLQEALNNVTKHARAKHVDVLLQGYGDHVSLIVEDDGIGFDVDRLFGAEHTGLGLIGMRERASLLGGSVDIESHVGDGTTFVARIPIRGVAPRAADDH